MEYHQIDLRIAFEKVKLPSDRDIPSTFQAYIQDVEIIQDLNTKLHNVNSDIEDLQLDSDSLSLVQLASNKQKAELLQKRRTSLQNQLTDTIRQDYRWMLVVSLPA